MMDIPVWKAALATVVEMGINAYLLVLVLLVNLHVAQVSVLMINVNWHNRLCGWEEGSVESKSDTLTWWS